jgi:hypothetical protein
MVLYILNLGTRRWVVSVTPWVREHSMSIMLEVGWVQELVRTRTNTVKTKFSAPAGK